MRAFSPADFSILSSLIPNSLSIPLCTLPIKRVIEECPHHLCGPTLLGLFSSLECPSYLCPSGKYLLSFKFLLLCCISSVHFSLPSLKLFNPPPQEINHHYYIHSSMIVFTILYILSVSRCPFFFHFNISENRTCLIIAKILLFGISYFLVSHKIMVHLTMDGILD